MKRSSWLKMDKLGLTILPPGANIGYHKTTYCWQGYVDHSSVGLAHSHDGVGKANRSEAEALFKTLKAIVSRYCDLHPRDKIWQKQLEIFDKIDATQASF